MEIEGGFVISAARDNSFKRCALNPMHLAWIAAQIKWLHHVAGAFARLQFKDGADRSTPSPRVSDPVLTAFPLDN